jgi:hypothetical protein
MDRAISRHRIATDSASKPAKDPIRPVHPDRMGVVT